ncbi:SAM-dependent methyltransferase [Frankia sp. AiPs1]|uniref:SAM-dependent methyltransferase n=1 Tax=Frankia sp. AiPs1 TaxID=573493 RepID=UPI002044B881|nr:SAM-dependent methyltransferase [Frankia sp. AiPs1]MCM3920478.1 SAM-dependent methyltransferase [Frankia sp. AiPs1]
MNDRGGGTETSVGTPGGKAADLRTDVAHSARIYDYLLGGKDNYPADRAASGAISQDWPNLPTSMRANRAFMARLARHLAAEHGIRQFLDIGTGLPTSPNLHEAAQQVRPDARVLYVDNDPIVLVHARALLTSTPEGRTDYLDADLTDPDAILTSEPMRALFDLREPVAVSLLAILHFIVDDRVAQEIIDRILAPLPAGSLLALSTTTADSAPDEVNVGVAAYNAAGIPAVARDKARVERFSDGLELLDPGVVLVHHWHPDPAQPAPDDTHVHIYGGLARKR